MGPLKSILKEGRRLEETQFPKRCVSICLELIDEA
jgi:hypothetical protein